MGRREDIEARMRALEAERAQLDRYGEDVYDDGDVIKFVKSFKAIANPTRNFVTRDHSARNIVSDFTYVALKANGKWHATGRPSILDNCDWDTLVEFMYTGIPVDHITIVIAEDFRTREELARELEELADKPLPPVEFPEVSIRRGGVQFPPRGVWSGVNSVLAAPSGEEQVDTIKTGGWCAPAAADLKLSDVADNEDAGGR